MGARDLKPKQGILIDGKKYKDGVHVRRVSKVKLDVQDAHADQGVKLGVRIAHDQEITELTMERNDIQALPRDPASEAELESNDPAGGEKWRAWRVPRHLLPGNLDGFRTRFRVTHPKGTQTVKWAVVYADQPFSGGYVIFGFADVGWNGAESAAVTVTRRPPSRAKPRRPKRGR
jgi:hypothetical protein